MIVTFYSFKGGVGRSHALVETAAQLARRGHSVLVWDLDLEAPGIQKMPALKEVDEKVERGTLDLLRGFLDAGYELKDEDLLQTLVPLTLPKPSKPGARLNFLLPARLDPKYPGEYPRKFGEIDWKDLFGREPRVGTAFFQDVASRLAGISRRPRTPESDKLAHEFVLIDSRTGYTDLSGVCVFGLPDLVVKVFTLNAQNLEGLPAISTRLARSREEVGREILQFGLANLVPKEPAARRAEKLAELEKKGLTPHLVVSLRPERLLTDSVPSLEGDPDPSDLARLVEFIEARQGEEQATTARSPARIRTGGADGLDGLRRLGIQERAKTFEEKVGDLYKLLGYQVTVDYALAGAHQYDLRLESPGAAAPSYYLVECKDLKSKVGVPDVEKFADAVRYATERERLPYQGILVSRSGFANNTHEVARTKLVTLRTYDEVLLSLVDTAPCVEAAIRGFEGTPLEALYVEQEVVFQSDIKPGQTVSARPLTDAVQEWMDRPGSGFLTLLGDFGAGKSSFARHFAHRLGKQYKEKRGAGRIPVLIDLRDSRTTTASLESLLTGHFQKLSNRPFNPQALLHLSREGHVLFIFDGFDEIIGYADPARYVEVLQQILRAAEGGAKVLLTCRTHYFRDQPEEVTRLGRVANALSTSGATELYRKIQERADSEIGYLLPFDDKRINEYLRRALPPPQDWSAARRQIESTYNLRDLASTPFLLDIITQTLPALASGKGTTTLWDLYEVYCQKWFEKNDLRLTLAREVRVELVKSLARLCWDAPGNRVHHGLLLERAMGLFDKALNYLDKERLDYEIRTATFLTRDADGNYGFLHKSFLEFFIARVLRDGIGAGDGDPTCLDLGRLTKEVAHFLGFTPEAKRIPDLVGKVLAGPYRPRISENALLLLYWHTCSGLAPLIGESSGQLLPERIRSEFGQLRPREIRLEGADLSGLVLPGIDLGGALLEKGRLDGADLSGASLKGAQLREAKFSGATLVDADLEQADLTNAALDHVDAWKACLARAVMENADIRFGNFAFARLDGTKLDETCALGAGFLKATGLRSAATKPATLGLQLEIDQPGWIPVASVAWSQHGLLAVASLNGTVHVSEVASAKPLYSLEAHQGWVWSVAWSPDGAQLATGGSDGLVRLWDARTAEPLFSIEAHQEGVGSVAWSSDGAQLATGGSAGLVRLWDARTAKPLSSIEGHQEGVWSVAWSSDGAQLATGGADGLVRLWDTRTAKPLSSIKAHQGWVRSATWSPDGTQLATGGADGLVRLWNARTAKPLSSIEAHQGGVRSVAWSSDGAQLATGGADGLVRLWDARTAEPLSSLEGHQGGAWAVTWSPDGPQLATGGADGRVRLWDARTAKPLSSLEGHQGGVWPVAWSPDGAQFATGEADGRVRLWDARTAKPLSSVEAHQGAVRSITWSPDGAQLATGGADGRVRLWDARTAKPLSSVEAHQEGAPSVAWSPDGAQFATGGADGRVRLWDARTAKPLFSVEAHQGWVWSMAWSPDGVQFATGGDDGRMRLWDAHTAKPLSSVEAHQGIVFSVAWSPDGAQLATGGADGRVRLWDAHTAKVLSFVEAHQGIVFSVAWSRDGAQLATGGADGRVRVWDARTAELLSSVEAHQGIVFSVAWSRTDVLAVATPIWLELIRPGQGGQRVRLMGAPEGGGFAATDDGYVAGDLAAIKALVRFGRGLERYSTRELPDRISPERVQAALDAIFARPPARKPSSPKRTPPRSRGRR